MGWQMIRCEQMVIGAMVSGRTLPGEAAHLRASDFAYRLGGQLFADVRQTHAEHPEWTVSAVAEDCASRFEHITPYLLSRAADFAQAMSAEDLHTVFRHVLAHSLETAIERQTATLTRPPANAALQHRSGAHTQLGKILARYADTLPGHTFHDEQVSDLFTRWEAENPATLAPTQPDAARRNAENTVLAGLMRHPDLAWTINGFLPAAVFTSTARNDIHRALSHDYLNDVNDPSPEAVSKALKQLCRAGHHEHRSAADRDKAISLVYHLAKQPVTAQDTSNAALDLYSADIVAYLDQGTPWQRPDPPLDPPAHPDSGPSTQPKP